MNNLNQSISFIPLIFEETKKEEKEEEKEKEKEEKNIGRTHPLFYEKLINKYGKKSL